jgi:GxxExxY protein
MTQIIYKEESYKIIGACMRVHSELGPGFLEAVYQEALEKEFKENDIPFERQHRLNVYFKGKPLKKYYIADFYCFDSIIVEIKVSQYISSSQFMQLKNYLKATKMKLGLLVCFGAGSLEYKRILNLY